MSPLLFAICWGLSQTLSFGARLATMSQRGRDVRYTHDKYGGLRTFEVQYTRSITNATAYLAQWRDAHDFGLFIQMQRWSDNPWAPSRVAALGISHGSKVLFFDMRPIMTPTPRALPLSIARFLEDRNKTFFGWHLLTPAAHLAFEYDVVVNGVDMAERAWPQLDRTLGLYGLANRMQPRVSSPLPERLNLGRLGDVALHTHLVWAVADFHLKFFGPPEASWPITAVEMYAAGPVQHRVPNARHNWTEARAKWAQQQREREDAAVEAVRERMRSVRNAWSVPHPGVSLPLPAARPSAPQTQPSATLPPTKPTAATGYASSADESGDVGMEQLAAPGVQAPVGTSAERRTAPAWLAPPPGFADRRPGTVVAAWATPKKGTQEAGIASSAWPMPSSAVPEQRNPPERFDGQAEERAGVHHDREGEARDGHHDHTGAEVEERGGARAGGDWAAVARRANLLSS
mmetsp:Transcript_78752/g.228631  ORF Transcript_78752/g.228631 Transcript_78752/m.228631 type:complete len:460 (+) Transcript_78752:92-1471(+)